MSEKATVSLGDKQIIIETGKLAKQADGAVTVTMGETVVLVATVGAAKAKPGQEFFKARPHNPNKLENAEMKKQRTENQVTP